MSTRYKHDDRVPTEVLADRLDELADAVVARMKGDDGPMDREFTCRIPAEMDRDPDLVLSAAARRLVTLEKALRQATEELESWNITEGDAEARAAIQAGKMALAS